MRIGRLTIYPFNGAMHGAWNFRAKRFYVCFKLPSFRRPRAPYFYISPNATPWAATLLFGSEYSAAEKRAARLRRVLFGHGYDAERLNPQRRATYHAALDKALDAVLSDSGKESD